MDSTACFDFENMSAENQIRERIKAYVADHHRWAMQNYSGEPTDPFRGVDTRSAVASKRSFLPTHCTNEWVEGEIRAAGITWPPLHDPNHEEIAHISVKSAASAEAFVIRRFPERNRTEQYYEFELKKIDDGWLIDGVEPHFVNPYASVSRQPNLAQFTQWRVPQIIPDDYSDGIESLFSGGVLVVSPDGVHRTSCKRVGELAVTSGYLVCSDLALWEDESYLLDLPVPPGRFPVDIVIDETSGRVAAARVVIDASAAPVKQICATRWERPDLPKPDDPHRIDSHYVATDTATIGLVDASALLSMTRRERNGLERRLRKAGSNAEGRRFASVEVNDKANAVAIETGFGDGIYPSFWLLSSKGEPVQLVFDFGILGQPVFREVRVPFTLKKHAFVPKSRELDELKAKVKFCRHEDAPVLQIVGGPYVQSVKALDSKGSLLFDGKDLDTDLDDDGNECYLLPEDVAANASGHLEICFFLKQRYELTRS
jgi:hypothetical protein